MRDEHRSARREACRRRLPVDVLKRAGGLVVDIAERYIEQKLFRDARVTVTGVLIVPVRHKTEMVAVFLARPAGRG